METLLSRSDAFEEALGAVFGVNGVELFDQSPRHLVSSGACLLSVEHAFSVRYLFAAGAPHSGTSLLRLQYEALLRGAWAFYAANDQQVAKLTAPLNLESEQGAKNLPGAGDMLRALVRVAPPGLTIPLQQFEVISVKALNSFVHSGIHPLIRSKEGFPQALGVQVVRNSNGLMHMAYRLLASLTGSQEQLNKTTQIYCHFQDCLPIA